MPAWDEFQPRPHERPVTAPILPTGLPSPSVTRTGNPNIADRSAATEVIHDSPVGVRRRGWPMLLGQQFEKYLNSAPVA